MTVDIASTTARRHLIALPALALLLSSLPATAQPSAAQTPAERVRAQYPDMPDKFVAEFAAEGGYVSEDASCDLLDWLLSPDSGASGRPREIAIVQRSACRLPAGDVTEKRARAVLGGQKLAAKIEGNELTVVARAGGDELRLCCSLPIRMERIGTSDLWRARVRLAYPEHALISLSIGPDARLTLRGPLAPAAPDNAIKAPLHGQLLLDRPFESAALGEKRRLAIYLPPGWSREKTWPALFMTDGGAASFAPMVERMIEAGEIPPIILVSAWSTAYGVLEGTPPAGDLRSLEYIRQFRDNRDRFEGHMRFFTDELVRYAQSEFGVSKDREDLTVAGYSNGGVFAAWAGLLHPEVFGNAIAMSPGVLRLTTEDLQARPRARFLFSAGLYEASFYATSMAAVSVLEAAGFDVTSRHLAAGHAMDQWAIIVHDRLVQIYGSPEAPSPAQAGRGLNM